MAVPAGLIFIWNSTNASIPANWARETKLDAQFIKGTADGVDPDVTGQGALTFFSTIRWAEGAAMALTNVNTKIDVAGFRVVSAGQYLGFIAGQNL